MDLLDDELNSSVLTDGVRAHEADIDYSQRTTNLEKSPMDKKKTDISELRELKDVKQTFCVWVKVRESCGDA